MIAVLQRIRHARVKADGVESGSCEHGLLILLGVSVEDSMEDVRLLADKIPRLRIFCDEQGKMNISLLDVGGGALIVSNFTLLANYSHGNRPDYLAAARPEQAVPLYEAFVEAIRAQGIPVSCGVFGADMQIDMQADGPVTIVMDSEKLKRGRGK
ncbi:MAG: D-tyrosyl-tRNA(Tyr) deacylase [Clostridia bacterium]|nr:D-tyrosyl-tRNA(Tyr) deacylase [Clostridia bacterium]